MRIGISNDHAGVELKPLLRQALEQWQHQVVDYGVNTSDPVDYPDCLPQPLDDLLAGKLDRVILLCGTGIGMAIVANRFPGIRCALCWDRYTAELSRRHNDANVLALRSRHIEGTDPLEITRIFLTTEFDGGRHQRRLDKLTQLEKTAIKELYQ